MPRKPETTTAKDNGPKRLERRNQEIHNADPCLPANDQKTVCQARVLDKHFQQSMIFRL